MHIIIPEIKICPVCAANIHVKNSFRLSPAKPYPGFKVKQLCAWGKIVSFLLDRQADKEI
jgi:hypothetical protein